MPNEESATKPKTRIFIVDDHPVVREGLALMMNREPDLTVCGEAEEASAALQAVSSLKPDLLIVDISLNGPDGLDLLKTHPRPLPQSSCAGSVDA